MFIRIPCFRVRSTAMKKFAGFQFCTVEQRNLQFTSLLNKRCLRIIFHLLLSGLTPLFRFFLPSQSAQNNIIFDKLLETFSIPNLLIYLKPLQWDYNCTISFLSFSYRSSNARFAFSYVLARSKGRWMARSVTSLARS